MYFICFFLSILVFRFLFYIFCLWSALYVPSRLAFFSFYLSLLFSFSCSPSWSLLMSILAFYFKLVSIWFSLFHFSFFLLFPLSFLFYLFHPLLFDNSRSLPLFLPPSHILYHPTAKLAGEVQSLTRLETSNNYVSLSSISKIIT